jgi:cytochrome c-type biogenesis protein CcmF
MVELTHRNTRRYGGYLVHMGVVLMFIGFTGKAFDKSTTVEVAQGGSVQLGAYSLKIVSMVADENDNYTSGS